ncbi:transposase [Streptomonospora wellingtoniae]|uniref:Transposase n=1 Tax=Streptomonospora wellingtoniae TaxID=3075544 RepID=A0ABU2KWK8_9ACTN|nr:transposase [Streptomonospora sp. DSM 45055]MDT0303428.1 transposase [Streptomonospora sp. DSM 45055]
MRRSWLTEIGQPCCLLRSRPIQSSPVRVSSRVPRPRGHIPGSRPENGEKSGISVGRRILAGQRGRFRCCLFYVGCGLSRDGHRPEKEAHRSPALYRRLVPDTLWAVAGPLVPPFGNRRQGGGTAPLDDRTVFTAVVYVLTSGCVWRRLPAEFAVSPATAHRRFTEWTKAGLWMRLLRTAAVEIPGELEWVRAIANAAATRAGTSAPSS